MEYNTKTPVGIVQKRGSIRLLWPLFAWYSVIPMETGPHGKPATSCRMCASEKLELVLDLGHQPHSDYFPTAEQMNELLETYPLRLVTCTDCGALQIDYFVSPVILYQQD